MYCGHMKKFEQNEMNNFFPGNRPVADESMLEDLNRSYRLKKV